MSDRRRRVAAQADVLRDLVGWVRVAAERAPDGSWAWCDGQALLAARKPVLAVDLTAGLAWGAMAVRM